jgi:hypothetical protein
MAHGIQNLEYASGHNEMQQKFTQKKQKLHGKRKPEINFLQIIFLLLDYLA